MDKQYYMLLGKVEAAVLILKNVSKEYEELPGNKGINPNGLEDAIEHLEDTLSDLEVTADEDRAKELKKEGQGKRLG